MGESVRITVGESDSGRRLDTVLPALVENLSRTEAQRLVSSGHVHVNGGMARSAQRVKRGDSILIERVPTGGMTAEPEAIALSIVYQDSDLVVIDKPAGMVVHPAPGHSSGTLANALVAMFPQTRDVGPGDRPGIVHRLDKNTSGLMVVALNPAAHRSLQRQIASRAARRGYLALVEGGIVPARGTIDVPIGRDPHHRKRNAPHGLAARAARTDFEVVEEMTNFTLVRAHLQTGRTHQIRVHFAALGHPVANDQLYGAKLIPNFPRHFLHAERLTLQSPSSGKQFEFTSSLPEVLTNVLKFARSDDD